MQLSTTTAILATLVASALAGPITVNRSAPTEIMKRESINDCEDSSFENHTSDGSPLVTDCQQLAANIADGGTWHLWSGETDHTQASYGTCIFGAHSGYFSKIGNQDIIDLINSSIDKFQWNGLVGAAGYVDCQNDGAVSGTHTLWWGIYHS